MTEETIEPQDEMEEVLNEEVVETEEVVEEPEAEETPEEQPKQEFKPKKKTFEERQAEMKKQTWQMRDAERKAAAKEKAAIEKEKQIQAFLQNPDNFESEEQQQIAVKKFTPPPEPQAPQQSKEDIYKEMREKERQEKMFMDYEMAKLDAVDKDPKYAEKEDFVRGTLNYYGSTALENVILDTGLPIELVNELAKDNDKLERIAQLPFHSAALEIGKLVGSLGKKPKPKFSKAPAPIKTVKGSAAPKSIEKMSYKEHCEYMNKLERGQ